MKTLTNDYLTHLNDPLHGGADKCDLSKYLSNSVSKELSILEIGPGSGLALENAIRVSRELGRSDRFYVVDIDSSILNSLQAKPTISDYKYVYFFNMDALKLSFECAFFDVINLSSVAHECSTYQGGYEGVSQLFRACARVLRPGGHLIYRELDCENFSETALCRLNGRHIQAFFNMFIHKFLDYEFCKFQKPRYYDPVKIYLHVGDKSYPLEHTLNRPLSLNHTTNNVCLEAPVGLIKELQRHFLTFLNAYIPEIFFDILDAKSDNGAHIISFEKNMAYLGFVDACKLCNVPFGRIDRNLLKLHKKDLPAILHGIENKFMGLSRPCVVEIPQDRFRDVIGITRSVVDYTVTADKNNISVPLPAALMLYRVLCECGCHFSIDDRILAWSIREGDEFYYFCDTRDISPSTSASSLLPSSLMPIHTSSAPRTQYVRILQRYFHETGGVTGYTALQEKRIIHFQRLSSNPSEETVNKTYSDIPETFVSAVT